MPSDQEYLFGVYSNLARYIIYTNKLHNNSLRITDFVSRILTKYQQEKLD